MHQTVVKAFPFVKIDGTDCRIRNYINTHINNCSLSIQEQNFQVKLNESPTPTETQESMLCLACLLGEHPMAIYIQQEAFAQCWPQQLSLKTWQQLPEDLQLASLQIICQDTFAQISEQLSVPLQLQGLRPEASCADNLTNLAIDFELHGTINIAGQLQLSAAAKQLCAEWCAQHDDLSTSLDTITAELPIPVHIELASTKLSQQELEGLANNDIILFPGLDESQQDVLLHIGHQHFSAHLDEQGYLNIAQACSGSEGLETSELTSEDLQEKTEAETPQDLYFTIRLEYPIQTIAYQILSNMQKGQRLPTVLLPKNHLHIYVEQQMIGTCRLVSIQNHCGAQIIEYQTKL